MQFQLASGADLQVLTGAASANITGRAAGGGDQVPIVKRAEEAEHGWAAEDWPGIYQQLLAADILVLVGPIWLGDNSSVTKQVIERLYACSHLLNQAGQYTYYGLPVVASADPRTESPR